MTDLERLKLSADAVGVDVEPYTWNDGTGYDHEGYRLVGTAEGVSVGLLGHGRVG